MDARADLTLREARAEDLPAITAIYGHHVRTGLASFETEAPDLAEMTSRYEAVRAKGFPYLVAEVGGQVAGYAYAKLPQNFFTGFGPLRGEQGDPAELPPREWPDRDAAGCHILYTSVRREANGSGWRTDYPWAQRNLLIRLSELTKARVSRPPEGFPHVWLVRLTDPALFGCGFVMASDVGTIGLSPEEADALGRYLRKGGFLWVDDFWGDEAWEQWAHELAQAMPPNEYSIEDVPLTDPIFRSMAVVKRIPQVPGIGIR